MLILSFLNMIFQISLIVTLIYFIYSMRKDRNESIDYGDALKQHAKSHLSIINEQEKTVKKISKLENRSSDLETQISEILFQLKSLELQRRRSKSISREKSHL